MAALVRALVSGGDDGGGVAVAWGSICMFSSSDSFNCIGLSSDSIITLLLVEGLMLLIGVLVTEEASVILTSCSSRDVAADS